MQKKYFTREQANQMIPDLEKAFLRITQMRTHIQNIYQRLAQAGYAPTDDTFQVTPHGAPAEVVDDLSSLKMLLDAVKQEIEGILSHGCLLKDLDIGLIDWFAKKEGRDIFLCWKLGEKAVRHWHEVDEGYKNRKLIKSREDN